MSQHYIYRMEIVDCDTHHGIYIGQHKIGSKEPSCDGYKGSGCKWKREILSKHIPVKKTILRVCDGIEETNFWERYYVEQAIQNGEFLWNVVRGGGGHDHERVYTDEEIKLHNKERCGRWYKANKEHHAEYGRQYRKNNWERFCATKKKYAEEHREYLREYHRQYYQNNKELFSEKSKQYYEEHKDKINAHTKEYWKQYSATHKEQLAEKAKLYNEEHKEDHKKYRSQLCCYNGETLTLTALSNRLKRKYHMPHPTQEAKKYLIKEI